VCAGPILLKGLFLSDDCGWAVRFDLDPAAVPVCPQLWLESIQCSQCHIGGTISLGYRVAAHGVEVVRGRQFRVASRRTRSITRP